MNKMLARRKAFTLVELLVVIAIISILAGMLLPALENAINAGHTIKCTNNQKQLSSAYSYYMSDNDGWHVVILDHDHPDRNPPPDNHGYGTFMYHLSPYLSLEWDDVLVRWPTSGPTVFFCPSAKFGTYKDELRNLCYGCNDKLWLEDYNGTAFVPPKIESLKAPSTTLLLADVWSELTDGGGIEPEKKPWNAGGPTFKNASHLAVLPTSLDVYNRWAWRHNEMLNMLYCDGHVSTRQKRYDGRPSDFRFTDSLPYWE